MVSRVISGADACGVVVVEDTVELSGHSLINHCVSRWSKEQKNIVLVALERPVDSFFTARNVDAGEHIVFVDCFIDPLLWAGELSQARKSHTPATKVLPCGVASLEALETAIFEAKKTLPDSKGSGTLLIFDSISRLILRHGMPRVSRLLHALSRATPSATSITSLYTSQSSSTSGSFDLVLCLIHRDMHAEEDELKRLEHLAQGLISVALPPSERRVSYLGVATVFQKRKSGRRAKCEEFFRAHKEDVLEFFPVVAERQSTASAPTTMTLDRSPSLQAPANSKLDPTSSLTFNLRLSEQEKIAKDAVALPWQHQGVVPSTFSVENVEDLDEDYDADDPDDDLDI